MDNLKILKDLSKYGKFNDSTILDKKDLDPNPIDQLVKWVDESIAAGIEDLSNMVLSTVSDENKSSSRVVLLKYITEKGLVFFTNYESRKGVHLEANPSASAVIFWHDLKRQIRIEGRVEKVSAAFSDSYFKERDIESQLSAIASNQSKVILSKEHIIEKIEELSQSFKGRKFIRPYFWGGYLLIPEIIEFWQGQSNRMHQRFQYRLDKDNWIIEMLAP